MGQNQDQEVINSSRQPQQKMIKVESLLETQQEPITSAVWSCEEAGGCQDVKKSRSYVG